MMIQILGFRTTLAASAQILTATVAKPMTTTSTLFAYVKPASAFTAQSVQRWRSAGVVPPCIVWVARHLMNVPALRVGEPFVIPAIRTTAVSNVTKAGVTIVTIA
mmetsp:Transcript_28422/g.40598  ORF Transcript_28422/g.40598 Transcript_28422/m.40598 type:complete len:105 (-) Transcript_28422:587-901(-)